jgi:hypothetical protein
MVKWPPMAVVARRRWPRFWRCGDAPELSRKRDEGWSEKIGGGDGVSSVALWGGVVGALWSAAWESPKRVSLWTDEPALLSEAAIVTSGSTGDLTRRIGLRWAWGTISMQ